MSITVDDGALVSVDPNDQVVIDFDWHTSNLDASVAIATSTFYIAPQKPDGASISSITRSGTTATVTTTAAHGLATGDYVAIAGANQADYNITASITVLTTTTFTYTVANSPTTPATGTIVYGVGIHKDNADILDDVEHDSRYTQIRIVMQGDRYLGRKWEVVNRIVTDEAVAQTKERSFFVVSENKSLV